MISYFDAHCDTLFRCLETGMHSPLEYGQSREEQMAYFARCEGLRQNGGHVDLQRGTGFSRFGQVFALFHDAAEAPDDGMWAQCNRLHEFFLREMAANGDLVAHCRNGGEIDAAVASGKCAALLSVEGADLIECDAARIETAANWGVRLMNPVWNRANVLSGTNLEESDRGLSEQGREFICELYRHSIYPDVSHLSDRGFWDLIEMAEGPVVASHSNSRMLCPHRRNLTDDQFRAIRDSGGVVGLNFYLSFVGENTMDALVAHLEHFLALGGEKTLCLGGDLDGCEVLASDMQGIQDVPRLYEALAVRGYGQALLDDLFWNNLRRLF
ncbi:MAG: membrane dipeptidase [Oscillospiraceae bacterium]|nr:membrane dipeptidase [Oscillospiraceae bacterium]